MLGLIPPVVLCIFLLDSCGINRFLSSFASWFPAKLLHRTPDESHMGQNLGHLFWDKKTRPPYKKEYFKSYHGMFTGVLAFWVLTHLAIRWSHLGQLPCRLAISAASGGLGFLGSFGGFSYSSASEWKSTKRSPFETGHGLWGGFWDWVVWGRVKLVTEHITYRHCEYMHAACICIIVSYYHSMEKLWLRVGF